MSSAGSLCSEQLASRQRRTRLGRSRGSRGPSLPGAVSSHTSYVADGLHCHRSSGPGSAVSGHSGTGPKRQRLCLIAPGPISALRAYGAYAEAGISGAPRRGRAAGRFSRQRRPCYQIGSRSDQHPCPCQLASAPGLAERRDRSSAATGYSLLPGTTVTTDVCVRVTERDPLSARRRVRVRLGIPTPLPTNARGAPAPAASPSTEGG